jgi:hypothetical protein
MQIKKYIALTLKEATSQMKKELGDEAIVLSTRIIDDDPRYGDKRVFELTAGIEDDYDRTAIESKPKRKASSLDRAQDNASKLAAWLAKRDGIRQVYYPGLSGHPGYKIHFGQASGPGAIISFRLKNVKKVGRLINKLKVITFAESLGGVESLITYPITQTHADIPESFRKRIGITNDLLRLSIGIENCNDLINDLDQAIGR